ncbi:hypothetical protein SAICODRAFT_8012 [Saitoella complicata NRRL Y-17804]|uniref:uncharacterized protein n=1 Tax=Saitoella complicata (strain BCRC 22490 / CBS 7301 / JCM 7358 / NBRC 10748 / NRRL Y-17804) TaxID=698492 RepID=UPI000866C648|nr:uncharacterized protein SAICODRAFT_8012 [Saitoella complicata NRRL Y-17804]ODQ52582.1 hypothetical protein SAICODRAFT_8012 [Saitoella complicata NRRL Y-17804]
MSPYCGNEFASPVFNRLSQGATVVFGMPDISRQATTAASTTATAVVEKGGFFIFKASSMGEDEDKGDCLLFHRQGTSTKLTPEQYSSIALKLKSHSSPCPIQQQGSGSERGAFRFAGSVDARNVAEWLHWTRHELGCSSSVCVRQVHWRCVVSNSGKSSPWVVVAKC